VVVTKFCTYTGNYPDRPEGPVVWFSKGLVSALSKLSRDVPEAIPVMLSMTRGLGSDGVIKIHQAEIAYQCNLHIQEVREVVLKLARAGLIVDTVISSEPEGTISCMMEQDYTFGLPLA